MTPELLELLLKYIDERVLDASQGDTFETLSAGKLKWEMREMVAPPEPFDDEGGPV